MITIKSKSEIELMKEACKLTGLLYEELEKHIKPGISTYELDKIAEKFMRAHGASPAQKGYNPEIKGARISNRNGIKLFLEWIYKDADLMLNRKYDKYQQFLNNINNSYCA